MAKNWTISESGNILTRNYKDNVEPLECNINALYISVMFTEMDNVEQMVIINGLKQKLDDAIARSKEMKLTEAEKREVQEELWLRMAEEREYNLKAKPRESLVKKAAEPLVKKFMDLGLSEEDAIKSAAEVLVTTPEKIKKELEE